MCITLLAPKREPESQSCFDFQALWEPNLNLPTSLSDLYPQGMMHDAYTPQSRPRYGCDARYDIRERGRKHTHCNSLGGAVQLVHSSSAGEVSTAMQHSRTDSVVILRRLWSDTERTRQRITNARNVKYSGICIVTFPTSTTRQAVRNSAVRRADTSKAQHCSSRHSRTERAQRLCTALAQLETGAS